MSTSENVNNSKKKKDGCYTVRPVYGLEATTMQRFVYKELHPQLIHAFETWKAKKESRDYEYVADSKALFYVRAKRPQTASSSYYFAHDEDADADVFIPHDLKASYLWSLGCSKRDDEHLQELAVQLMELVKAERRLGSFFVVEPHTWHGQENEIHSYGDWSDGELEVEDFGYLGKGFY